MCLAIPGKVIEMVDPERQIAKVEVAGVRRNVNVGLLTGDERPELGDYVLIHVGFALSKRRWRRSGCSRPWARPTPTSSTSSRRRASPDDGGSRR
jgi:hydrogenase assembly chaperone HypC/HupF